MAASTATAPAETTTNDIEIEDVGPARKRITITVPADVVDGKLSESLHTLAHETVLPGFRKGRVPQKLLERRFGSTLRNETKNQIIASAYASAIEQHKLQPVGEPEPGEGLAELELEQGKPLKFSVEVEVVPEFELPKFDEIEIKKPLLEITPDFIEGELLRQQYLHGTPLPIADNFQEGDRLGGHAKVVKEDDAEPFFDQPNVLVVIPVKAEGGRGQVLGLMIDGLYDLLIDKKVGDTVTITTTGPEGHEREDIRGAKLTITFEIKVAERIMPAPAETVAKAFALANVEVLREQIRFALEHRRDQEQAAAMRDQAVDQLAAEVDLQLPERLSAQQSARTLEQYRLDLLYKGLSAEDIEQKLAEAREESETLAQDRLKKFFILQKLGEHFKVEVTDQEINGRIAAMAAKAGVRPEKLRTELSQSGRLGEVARMVRDEKAADRLVSSIKQVEVSADEWNKTFRDQQEKGAKSGRSSKSGKPAKTAKSSEKAETASKEKPAKSSKGEDAESGGTSKKRSRK